MIDTHTHLYLPEFEGDGDSALSRAVDAGVGAFVMPNVDAETEHPLLAMRARHPDKVYTAWGLHPTSVDAGWREALSPLLRHLADNGCVAVGEIGIDLYWDRTFRSEQMDCFAFQVKEAHKKDLPVIIHCREGLDETLEVLRKHALSEGCVPKVVFHSFTGSSPDVSKILSVVPEAFFGINGVVTFKNARELREAMPEIGINRIVLETDSPYLAPVPFRGKRNESAYIVAVRDKIAETLGIPADEVERITDANARRLFPLIN